MKTYSNARQRFGSVFVVVSNNVLQLQSCGRVAAEACAVMDFKGTAQSATLEKYGLEKIRCFKSG